MNRLTAACRLARLAQQIDDDVDKTSLTPDELSTLRVGLDAMHEAARSLAGEHAHEIYACEAEAEQVRKRYAKPQPQGAAA